VGLVLTLYVVAAWWCCFLIADARIFGCDTTGYNETPMLTDGADPARDKYEQQRYDAWVRETGVIKVRQYLLRISFFRELFSCYYCLGSLWVGVPLHLWFREFFGPRYLLHHADEASLATWVFSALLGCALAGTGAYALNKAIDRLS